MNLREEILGRVNDNKVSDSIMFSTVIKAYSHDYKLIGENATELYVDVFGESTREFFNALAEEPEQLIEFAGKFEGSMLLEASDEDIGEFYLAELGPSQLKPKKFEGRDTDNIKIPKGIKNTDGKDAEGMRPEKDAWMGHGGPVPAGGYKEPEIGGAIGKAKGGSAAPAAAAATTAVSKAVASKGWLAKIWDKIKQSGMGIKDFFKNNPNLLKALGIAGGVGVGALAIAKIAKMLKNRKEQQKQLQTKQA